MRRPGIFFVVVSVLLLAMPLVAQDPTTVDPKHYKVVFENDQVRVVRITYGPYEKSVMHQHPAGVAVFLADQRVRMTFPDGKTEERSGSTGEAVWAAGEKHLPENLSNVPLDLILVEMKTTEAWKRISGRADCAEPDQANKIEVGDQPGHSFMVSQGKCAWDTRWKFEGIQSQQGMFTTFDEMSGDRSRFHGYYRDTLANGDQIHYRYKGRSHLRDGEFQSGESKWKIIGGTGKFEGIKGKGTCKGKGRVEGGVSWECEGKYRLSK